MWCLLCIHSITSNGKIFDFTSKVECNRDLYLMNVIHFISTYVKNTCVIPNRNHCKKKILFFKKVFHFHIETFNSPWLKCKRIKKNIASSYNASLEHRTMNCKKCEHFSFSLCVSSFPCHVLQIIWWRWKEKRETDATVRSPEKITVFPWQINIFTVSILINVIAGSFQKQLLVFVLLKRSEVFFFIKWR